MEDRLGLSGGEGEAGGDADGGDAIDSLGGGGGGGGFFFLMKGKCGAWV